MAGEKSKIRMIMATLGLEVHWRGAITVTRLLRDHGFEMIYMGSAYPETIINAAIQEDVNIVGVSTLTGGHLVFGNEIMNLAKQHKINDSTVFVMGGIIPSEDISRIKEFGFDGVFGPGSKGEDIYKFLVEAVAAKLNNKSVA